MCGLALSLTKKGHIFALSSILQFAEELLCLTMKPFVVEVHFSISGLIPQL